MPSHPSGAFCKLLTLTLSWTLWCVSALAGQLFSSLGTVRLVFETSQSYHNLGPTTRPSHTCATVSSQTVLP